VAVLNPVFCANSLLNAKVKNIETGHT